MAKPDGGPAHPFHHLYQSGDARESYGMSLRQWYAGQALALSGDYFHHNVEQLTPTTTVPWNKRDGIARECVAIADAILAELGRER